MRVFHFKSGCARIFTTVNVEDEFSNQSKIPYAEADHLLNFLLVSLPSHLEIKRHT